jgi:hypothetical protein
MTSKLNEEAIVRPSSTIDANTTIATSLQAGNLVDKSDFQVENNKDDDEKEMVQVDDNHDDFILVKSKRRSKHKRIDMLMASAILNSNKNNNC